MLDIAQNSVAAGAGTIAISVEEDLAQDRLRLKVEDDGRGMDPERLARLGDPFNTSRTTRKVGLGIPLLKEAAESCAGWLRVRSAPGRGTCLEAELQRSHIDCMPLGDLAGTFLTLVASYPDRRWRFTYRAGERRFEFDTEPIRAALGDLPWCDPVILTYLRQTLESGVDGVQERVEGPKWSL